jgi:DNA transposition AAA+ family ATPase
MTGCSDHNKEIIMGETIDALPEVEIDLIRHALADALGAEKLSGAAASVAIGIGSSTLALWRTGKYSGDNSSTARKVKVWLDGRESKAKVRAMLPDAGYVPTPTSLAFMDCLEQAQYVADMVVIACAAGLGKTTSCIRYGQTHA